ncbi:hypothetical protein CYMTET_3598, partial [Cymbomonas tetramitiformis]
MSTAAEELSALRAGHNIFCLKGEARQADSVVKERRLECSVEVPGTGMERRCTIRYLTEGRHRGPGEGGLWEALVQLTEERMRIRGIGALWPVPLEEEDPHLEYYVNDADHYSDFYFSSLEDQRRNKFGMWFDVMCKW